MSDASNVLMANCQLDFVLWLGAILNS